MSIGERIKKRRKELKLSADKLGELIGKDRATIYRYEKDEIENLPISIIPNLAIALKTDEAYLMGWINDETTHNHYNYPYYPVSVSAGLPVEVDGIQASSEIPVPDIALSKYAGAKDIYFIHANGDSMDKQFPDNTLLAVKVINDKSELCNGDIVVFSTDGDFSVKRFYKTDDKLIFKPESNNPIHTDQIYSSDDVIHIHGKVVTYIVNL